VQVLEVDPNRYFFKEPEFDLTVDPLKENGMISLDPIYFEQSRAIILPQSFGELNRLAEILQNNPGISIQIEGHTDNIGEWESLQKLSEDRAAAVGDFLVEKGIERGRIATRGYGASMPVNNNMNEEQRRENRRVEIRITKIDD